MLFTRKRQAGINSASSRTSWTFAAVLSLAAVAIVGYALNHARPSEARAIQRTPVESFNIGTKMTKHRVQLGTDTTTNYRAGTLRSSAPQSDEVQPAATQAGVAALQQGQARPLSMTSEDFNGDGMQDLVVGYSSAAGGMLTLRAGNVEAISPQSPVVLANLREGIYPSPFLNDVDTFSLPESPDFLATGDFNADGNADVVATARGGQTLYLFTGDGHGGLSESRQVSLDGQVTAMTKGQFNERNGTASLALGVVGPDGASVQIFDEAGQGVLGSPEKFSLPSAVMALTLARLDNDSAGDLAVTVGNRLFVIHGRNQADPYANRQAIEHYDLPYDVVGITAGNFIFDRESKPKLALLSTDGMVHFMTPGPLDLRPYTSEELALRQKQRIKIHRGEADEASLIEMEESMLQRPGMGDVWMEVENRFLGVIPTGVSPQSLLTTTRDAGATLDELLVLDSAGNKVQMVDNENDAARVEALRAIDSVDLGSAPVAVLTTRLSTDGRPGTVVLEQNQVAPGLLIPTANTFNVTSNADLPDLAPGNGTCLASNGLCTLRAAIMESNYRGSSNTINLLASTTYTLTQGPPDDEFDALSDDGTAGDLDILDLFRICSQLGGGNPAVGCPGVTLGGTALTSVTIAGGNINTTVIAMGVLSPTAGAPNAGLNHDRVFDVNNFANPQFNTDVTFSNLTIQNGNAPHYQTSTPGAFYHTPGGAIQFDGINNVSGDPLGILTFTTCKITNNIADGQGGGIFALEDTLLVQTSSVVTLNTSTLASGGGISYGGGNKVTTQTMTISSSTVGGAAAANNAPDTTVGNGAGVSSVGGSGATISNSTISNNVAGTQGGGVAFVNTVGIAISNSTISGNTAKSNGGGIYTSARNGVTQVASTTTLTTTNVTGNTADSDTNGTGNGGGVYNLFGTLTAQTTTHIDGNTAFNGGGIFDTWTQNTNDLPGSVVVNTSSTVGQTGTGNTAKNNGGGIAIDVGGNSAMTPKTGSVTLTSVTVQGNTANSDNSAGGDGGGIHDNGNDANFKITLSLDGATIDSNVANSGGGGGTGDGMFLNTGTVTGANTVSFNGDDTLNINGGTFTSTSGTLNLAGSFTRATAGTFTHNSGTVNFNGGGAQNINGTATSETFNNFTVNKTGTLTVGGSTTSLTIAGNVTLTAGTFAAGTATAIGLTTGSWTNNGGTFTPSSSVVSFTNTAGAQNINGSALTQTFNGITVAKTAQTLAVGGGTTTLTLNGTMTLTSGTFSAGTAAAINVGGDWTNNGGTFTPGSGTVTFNSSVGQNLNGSAGTQTFNNFAVNKGGGTLTGGGSTIILNLATVTLTAGTFAAGTATDIRVSGDWTNNGGIFTAGAGAVLFNSASVGQSINGTAVTQTFNNLTISKVGQTLSVGGGTTTLDINGSLALSNGTLTAPASILLAVNFTQATGTTFTPGAGTVTFDGAGAQSIDGTLATKTFNNFVVNKSNTLSCAASTTALTISGNLTITAGTFSAGTATAIGVAGNWANTGTFTGGAGTVTLNGNNNTQTLTGTTTFNNLTINHSGTGGVTATGSSLTVSGLLEIQGGTFTSSSTFTNVQIDSGATLASDGSQMNVSGNWTNNGGTFTPSGNTVNFTGGAAQLINGTAASQTFNNVIVNKSGGSLATGGSTTSLTVNNLTNTAGTFTAPATLNIGGNLLLTAGTLTAGTNTNVTGNWTNNGATFTAGSNTVTFNGGAGQTIGGTTATTFNNLTNSNASGLSMTNDNTVNAILALTSGDITVAATKTLTQPLAGSSSGTFDVNGRVQRNGFVTGGAALSFGNLFNSIQVTAGTAPANIVVDLVRSVPTGGQGYPTAVQRTYTITPSAAGFTGTLRLHYKTSELNSNDPTALNLWRFDSGINAWRPNPATSRDCAAGCTTNNSQFWVERTGVTTFSPWTLNSTNAPTAGIGTVSGRITGTDGTPIAGATINLSGNQSRETITDAQGNYSFDSVEINGFYTVTPARVNYAFSPANRSFSLLGVQTEASFTATANGDRLNAIDTTEFFVRQQYLDFLGREPDPPGFIGWVNTIRNCAAGDTSCDRMHVSEAFFRSAEFQERGYFVYRFYSTAFGQKPEYAAFVPDLQRVSGFLDATQLEAAKTQFASDFVTRPAFAPYATLSNAQYVDALSQTAGVTLGNRQALVDSLNAGTLTRAQVLRQIAESGEVYQRYYNQAFVVMEYFGYLRRDPDILYLNWIDVLNQGGDSRRMVEGFVDATEYRNRFRQ